jgi:hypothetical protein
MPEEEVLPKLTKIAAWLLIIRGILFIFLIILLPLALIPIKGMSVLKEGLDFKLLYYLNLFFPITIFDIFLILPGVFVLKKKKFAWIIAIILCAINILLIGFVLCFRYRALPIVSYFLIYLFIFILLIFDRKNFFKVAK